MILYACVAAGTEILAEQDLDPSSSNPLRPLAAHCLRLAPKFHALYTHTVRGRIYAFLMDNHNEMQQEEEEEEQQQRLVFFSIADEALGRANTLIFLHRLRTAYKSNKHPAFPQLVLSLIERIAQGDETGKKERANVEAEGSEERGERSDDGHGREVEAVDRERSCRKHSQAKRKPPVDEAWRRHVRSVILVDVVICSLMFVVWLTLCRGFQCIT